MNITFRQLQIFTRIAQEGSITAAAERLFLTKPAVSTALSELEKQCGYPLFDRHNNRLYINELGKRLLPVADELLQRRDDIATLFNPDAGAGETTLRLGASFTIGQQLIPWLLRAYQQKTGYTRQVVTIGNSQQISQQIAAFELDIGLIEGKPERDDIKTEYWMSDRMLIAAHPQHPLVGKVVSTPADLSGQKWVLRESGSASREIFMNRLAPLIPIWHTSLELNATEAIINATAAGLGLSCLSELAARQSLVDGRLIEIPINLDLQRPLYLAWHRHKYQSPALSHFSEFTRHWRPLKT